VTVYVETSTLKDGLADSSTSSSQGKPPELKEKPNDLLHIPFARAFSLLVTDVGTELAPGNAKTPPGV
jgi:hypothetical protein